MQSRDDHALAVLKFAVKNGFYDQLFWFEENGAIVPCVNCNDLFSWATADCEDITPDDMPLLIGTFEEVAAISVMAAACWGVELFACRKRNVQPQPPVMKRYGELLPDAWNAVKHLWDALPENK